MKNIQKVLILVASIMCGFTPFAYAAVIDFEAYGAGTIIDSEYGPDVTVRAVNHSEGPNPDVAVVFDTMNPTGNDEDLRGPFNSNNANLEIYSPGNVLIIHETNNCDALTCDNPDDEGSRNAGTFYFDFSYAVTLGSIDFFDIEAAENTLNSIRLFDTDDNELMAGAFFVPVTGGDNLWDQLLFNVDNVKRIELNMGGSGAIDNIAFERFNEEIPVPQVPVPAAIWLFGSGLIGLIGFARRKSA